MLGISKEFLLYCTLKAPFFLWLRNLDRLICKLDDSTRNSFADCMDPLMHEGKWSRIDLIVDPDKHNAVIGFDTLHLGTGSDFIPRLFNSTTEITLPLSSSVRAINAVVCAHDPEYGFHQYEDFFADHPIAEDVRLEMIDEEKEEKILLTRELFMQYGGKLLS